MIERRHLIFRGTVQGVGFRFRMQMLAQQHQLSGWVRNCYDGTVEAEIQGDYESINQMLTDLSRQRFIEIESIDSQMIEVIKEKGFRIDY